MNDAVRLNNDAMDLLISSNDDSQVHEGIALLTKSLRLLKSNLLGQDPYSGDDSADSCSSRPNLALGRRLASIVDSPCSGEDEDDTTPSNAQSNFIFKRMFRLFPTTCPTLPNTIQIYIACVIFNLALLHQHQAASMQPGNLRRCLLEKAALLYQSCFQILPGITAQKGTEGIPFDDVIFLLKVGSLNNSAQILYECDEYEQACERLAMVESILCSQGISETQCCFTVQEFEGILSNVLLLKPPTVAVAA